MRVACKRVAGASAALVLLGTSNCVRVPSEDVAASPPSMEQIVTRVKCDLVHAVREPLEDPNRAWFQTWTAQVSLNFIVNDQSSLTPGATFIEPLVPGSIPLRVTNGARAFNLGVGAGVNTTATRNETVTFSMSLRDVFDELKAEARKGEGATIKCLHDDSIDLHSELGLDQWVHDALQPAKDGFLIPGHHKSSKAGGQAPSASPGKGGGGSPGAGFLREMTVKLKGRDTSPCAEVGRGDIDDDLAKLRHDLAKIQEYEIDDPSQADTPPQPPQQPGQQQPQSPPKRNKIITYVDKHLNRVVEDGLNHTRSLMAEMKSRPRLSQAEKFCLEWAKAVEDYLLPLELDPPIDTIAHQVQFIVAANGSISPNWTLIRFKGPTTGSSLASATKTLTHTLNVTIGPPSSPDAVNQMNALLTSTAVTNSLNITGTLH